jgi:putative flavoprotein involved in K+ transport
MTRFAGNLTAGTVDVIVIGAGHSGLAMSRMLSHRSIDHLVLERGEIANSWIHERWDSLKLLTPNWQSRLPGFEYDGDDPDGYMNMSEVAAFIRQYADASSAPVMTGTEVRSVTVTADGYRVATNRGTWQCKAVVAASGAFNKPSVPAISAGIPGGIAQLTPHGYRNPAQLEEGGVLIVGASATGLQLAEELQASGRPVTIAVGEHVRMPRTYRGRDIQYWMHVVGLLDERYDHVDDIRRARGGPSPQLIGSDDRRTLDLNTLQVEGVQIAGRLAGIRDGKAHFSGSLRNVCKLADLKMNRMLDAIDDWITKCGGREAIAHSERFEPTWVGDSPLLGIDLCSSGIRTVIWATGFRPDYSWLDVPVLDRKGRLRHDGGVVDSPGLYVLGLPYLRRRKSSFMHGAEDDVRDLSAHLAGYLNSCARRPAIRLAG